MKFQSDRQRGSASSVGGKGKRTLLVAFLVLAITMGALTAYFFGDVLRPTNTFARQLAANGSIASVEVIAFPNIIVPVAGPDSELLIDGCRFNSSDQNRIRQLVEFVKKIDAGTSNNRTDVRNDLAIIFTSVSGKTLTLTGASKNSAYFLTLASEKREIGRYIQKSNDFEDQVYEWIDQGPVVSHLNAMEDLCRDRAHSYVAGRSN